MWIQIHSIRTVFSLFLAALLTLGLGACGGSGTGGGSASTTGSSGTGTVAVTITDAPGSEFDEINVTVTRIQLLSDGGQVTIFEGNKTFNLLQLSEVSQFFIVADGVPPGPWSKIRLTLSDLELVRKDDQGNVTETFHPHLPGNGKLDFNPRMGFFVVPGATLLLQLDMDAKKSILVVPAGADKYQFRPVVFVSILEPGALGKIIRLKGTVAELGDNEFKLCLDDDPGLCVEVHLDDNTALFDDQAAPTGFDSLEDGLPVIVYARFRPDDGNPTDDPDDDSENDFDVDALVVEVGPPSAFTVLRGTISNRMNGTFNFLDSAILVQLQNETRIFSKDGEMLDAGAITDGLPATASGVLSSSTLTSTIVILDTSTP